ncbi:hypothetical protein EDD18DRAFT_1312611 [Armillaria luteobubalina]|uniref:Protein-S-isoprenylcysteine O-methyltransferase n=1 Tax=Armillaria luteobubalina TaxID=153913 RepID=A0AA39P672_9AGAR|nr:hypothetical protein EDD18DRAFT_1312611 [Armillaria luteobubalina]
MSILKVPILLVGAYNIWKALTPPHHSTLAERFPPSLIGRFALSFSTFLKATLILSSQLMPQVLIHMPTKFQSATMTITPSFLIGTGLAIAGAQLRLACYRTLGHLFTFEMAIRKDHELITTGPYAYVRHPAYAGLLMTMAGEAVIQCSRGSWLQECRLVEMLAMKVYLSVLISPMLLLTYSSTMRGWHEDAILKEKFGDDWTEWAMKTPYRLIPFIY